MSKLYYRYGAMNSGKSTALIQVAYNYEERGQRVLIIKPDVDTKSEMVVSRIGVSRKVDICVKDDMDLYHEILARHHDQTVHCIVIDEAQFLRPEHVDQLLKLAVIDNIPVIAYGLRGDFQTHAFPGSLRLLELSHSIEEMKTICRCGSKSTFNGRKINGKFVAEGAQIAIDGQQAEYESLCGRCYIENVGEPTCSASN